MTPVWASAAVAILVMTGTSIGLVFRAGRRDGKLDSAITQLAEIARDHEDRLRAQEARPARHRPR